MVDAPSPAPEKSAGQWLAEIERFEGEGELFRAHDLAMQALEAFPADPALKHRGVLCLASTGATAQAAAQFGKLLGEENLDLLPSSLALDVATLRARLLKDQALAVRGIERVRMLRGAAEAYACAYRAAMGAGNREAYYPGINCATLRLLAGDRGAATALAREILATLAARPLGKKTYYELATEAEAYLILGDGEQARAAARQARAHQKAAAAANFRDLASTIRQLRLIATALSLDTGWLTELAPPQVIHYLGHVISPPGSKARFPAEQEGEVAAAIAAVLDAKEIGFGYGSLAAGADILFAEALLARGASVDVVLPFAHDEFIEVSVRPSGAAWIKRFHACLERAASVRYATEDRYRGEDFLFGYCSDLAMGLALLRAHHLETRIEQIAVWDGRGGKGLAGTARDVMAWKRANLPQTVIPVAPNPVRALSERAPGLSTATAPARRPCAVLFSDVKGFSKLTDDQVPGFFDTFLSAFARVVDGFATNILFANTWGDGLYLVFADAGKAARCALELQGAVAHIDLADAGLPADMGLRIGGHFGPVYAIRDPILKRRNFFGAHVSRTARIEPVTPEGCVYVTETLAAVLSLHNTGEFTCTYVGMTDAAKGYGKMRMFLLSYKELPEAPLADVRSNSC